VNPVGDRKRERERKRERKREIGWNISKARSNKLTKMRMT